MRTLDDHIASRVDEDQGRVARVGLHEPYDDGDVIGHALKEHRDSAVGLKEIDGPAVVVGEDSGLGLERRVCLDEGEEVLAYQPLEVLRVGQSLRASLGEDAVQKLLGVLGAGRGGDRRRNHRDL